MRPCAPYNCVFALCCAACAGSHAGRISNDCIVFSVSFLSLFSAVDAGSAAGRVYDSCSHDGVGY